MSRISFRAWTDVAENEQADVPAKLTAQVPPLKALYLMSQLAIELCGPQPFHNRSDITFDYIISTSLRCLVHSIVSLSSVKVGAWIPHHDRHLSIQSYAKICKGMPPKGAPKSTSTGSSSDTVEQATILIGAGNIQSPKGPLFALGGLALLAASCQKPRMARLYILGRPLRFHKVFWQSSSRTINFHMKFTMNKFRKKLPETSYTFITRSRNI